MSFADLISSATDSVFIGLVVGAIISELVTYWPAFEQKSPKAKRLWVLGFSLAVPAGLTALGLATGFHDGTWGDLPTTWYPALQAGVTAFAGATAMHTRRLRGATVGDLARRRG